MAGSVPNAHSPRSREPADFGKAVPRCTMLQTCSCITGKSGLKWVLKLFMLLFFSWLCSYSMQSIVFCLCAPLTVQHCAHTCMEWVHPSDHGAYRGHLQGQIHSRSNSHSPLPLTSAQAHHEDLSQLICVPAKSPLQLGTCRECCGCSCPSSQCLTKAKLPRRAGCAHTQSLIPGAQPPLAGSMENATAHSYALQGAQLPRATAKQESLAQRPGWPWASTHLLRWHGAGTPGSHLIAHPSSGCCFHWRKSPANKKI